MRAAARDASGLPKGAIPQHVESRYGLTMPGAGLGGQEGWQHGGQRERGEKDEQQMQQTTVSFPKIYVAMRITLEN